MMIKTIENFQQKFLLLPKIRGESMETEKSQADIELMEMEKYGNYDLFMENCIHCFSQILLHFTVSFQF